jgi:hypothetical protein
MTVKELIEQLQNLPEDYKVELRIEYQEVGDVGDGWRTLWTDDIETPVVQENKKTVSIKAWE